MNLDLGMFLELLRREFKVKSGKAAFGLLWLILDPIISILLLFLIVGLGMKKVSSHIPFMLYLAIGVSVFTLFQRIITQSTTAFSSYAYLLKKVAFPFEILPIVKIVMVLILMILSFVLVFVVAIYFGYLPSKSWLLFFPWFFLFMLFSGSLAYIFCFASTLVADFNNILGIAFRFGYWCTPIFWDLSIVPQKFQVWVWLNPMTFFIESFRDIITDSSISITTQFYAFVWTIVSLMMALLSVWLFKKFRSVLLEAV